MKLIKRLFSFLLFLLVVVIIGIIAIPFLYKDKVITYVKEEANKTLNAKMDFEEVDISLLRSFPDLNVRLENVTVDGVAAFEGVRLFEAVGTEVELNVLDAFAAKDNFPIKTFFLNQPVINLLVLKDGQANWDIMKPSEEVTEESNFLVKMKQYTVENGTMTYEDRSLDMKMAAKDLNHTGSGQFASDNFDLATRTHISNLNVEYEGIDYLKNATADLDALIAMDIPNMKFTLKDNELLLNALKINTSGTFDMNGEDYVMDLTFNSPQGDFKSLWSLIPGVFTADYAAATINGKMGFKGFLKGTYNGARGRYPAFQIKADVDNGNVKYPDLPVGIAGIFTNMKIESPSSDFDKMVVDIPQFKMQVGDNPVSGAFNLTTPVSDPTIKGNLKGIINLEEMGRAVPIEGITELKGIVKSDVVFNASQSQLDKGQYEQVNIEGTMSMDDVSIQQTGTPPIVINNMTTDFSPQRVKLESFNATLGESDIQATGQIDNVLAYFSPDKTMEGTINYSSNYFNVNEWMSETEASETTITPTTDSIAAPFDRFNFKVDGFINKMDYDTYQLTDVKTTGSISPNESTIDNFSTVIGKSDIQASGKVVNLMDYALENEVLTGEIQLKSKYLDLNQFMVEGEATDTTEAMSVVPVPERVDLIMHTKIDKVHYTNFDIQNINGFIEVKEEVAKMEDIQGKILGGDIKFGGSYDTKDMAAPKFTLNYDLAKLDFNNAFNTFNTFRLIAPLGKYIDGKFTSNLKMSGTLGKDLVPDLSSLNLSGFLHTFGATIRESQVFERLSEKLQVKALKNVKLQDSKNWVDIKDGYLELEEATHKIGKDISLKVKGRHHLLQEDLFYLIEANIPKSEINKTAVGQVANQGWELLAKEAQKRGVDIDNGDMVKLNINMTGSMAKPIFKIIPVGTDGTVSFEEKANEIVKATVDKAVDSVKTTVNQKVDSVKNVVQTQVDSVKTVVNEVKDSLKVVAQEKTDQVLDKGKAEASKIIDSVLVKNIPALDSLLLKDSSKVTDKVKDILKDFNPFKKKKNGN